MTTCAVEGCTRPRKTWRRFCHAHLNRLRRDGDLLADVPIGQKPRLGRLAEVVWLSEAGMDRKEVARALGIKPASLHRLLLRHNRLDLWRAA